MSSLSLTLAMNVMEGNKQRSKGRMWWLGNSAWIRWMATQRRPGEDAWGLLLSERWTATMVSEASKGAGCCFMSAGWGGGIGIGGGVGMGVCVGSAFAKEEDGRCWLVNRVSIFRRRRSSLAAMEAWVTTRSAMAVSRRSKHSEESSSSAIGVLNESTKLL